MPCVNPNKAWQDGYTKNGKMAVTFKDPETGAEPMLLPCGRCVSCKLSYAREWATRIVHEAQTQNESCFITLTYSDENIPEGGSLDKQAIRLFIKRLRKKIALRVKTAENKRPKLVYQKIKYFACAEYGSKRKRPHYHLILLGYDFRDKTYWSKSELGNVNYRSKTLEELWTLGHSTIGEVNYKTAGYVARYTFKKATSEKEYKLIDYDTGEYNEIEKEFIRMSKGIGKEWWKKYGRDTYKDYINAGNRKNKVPRYYDKMLENKEPKRLEKIKENRIQKAIESIKKPNELKQQEKVMLRQSKMLIRGMESE